MPSKSTPFPTHPSLDLPALRGKFGDWTYYSAVVPMTELAHRVSFADEIHTNPELSSWIQRSLKGQRAEEIASYLKSEKERFFNSLVIALYGGTPEWVPLSLPPATSKGPNLGEAADVLGVLRLSGGEKLFAVDGQHRLAGMKEMLKEGDGQETDGMTAPSQTADLVSILVVAHRVDEIIRTRRLFTTLNKTAVPVSKMERIALDENDAMAIIARQLVEENSWFQSPRIAMSHTNNLGREDGVALTTIGNLYDVLKLLFLSRTGLKKKELEYSRPSDSNLQKYLTEALDFFKTLSKADPALGEYFSSADPASVCSNYRTSQGGSIYFRPLGLLIMTEVAETLREQKHKDWKKWLFALPNRLEEAPFAGTIWSHRQTIDPKNRVLCRDLLYYMCDIGSEPVDDLRDRLRTATGNPRTSLPRKLAI